MRTYETIFIVRPDVTTEEAEGILEFFKSNITDNGGEVLTVEPWGKIQMAYEIENFREGIYYLIQFKANEDYITELQRRYRYNEQVLRFIVVHLDEKKFKAKPKKDPVQRPGRKPRRDDDRGERGERKPREEAPKKEEAPKADAPKAEAPKAEETPKTEEAPKAEEAKTEEKTEAAE